jgi:hypothetical protein
MAIFGETNNINAEAKYDNTFYGVENNTVYADPVGSVNQSHSFDLKSAFSVDMRSEWSARVEENLTQLKSMGTGVGGTGLTDNVLIPIAYRNELVDLTKKQTPISFVIRSVTNKGIVAPYKQVTSKPTAFFAAENATLATSDPNFDVLSENIKYMYAKGSVTGPLNSAAPSYNLMGTMPPQSGDPRGQFGNANASNANQLNILLQARALLELEEETLINGDKTTNPEEFDGIVSIMSTTNTVAKSASALDLDDYVTAARYAYEDGGYVNFAFCDTVTYQKTLELVNDKVSLREFGETQEYGFTAIKLRTGFSNGAIPLVPSRFLSTTAAAQSAYLLDLSVWEKRVLQDMTYEKLAKTKDSDEFFLKKYMCLICMAEQFNASITGMTN